MLKFDKKTSVFGFPKHKHYILLADYLDRSLMRTAYMCEVSRAIGIEYTVNYQHVDLYLNDDYQGVYILTEKVEKSKEKVNIEDDGFIIELDDYYKREPLYFTTSMFGYSYTFKYPDADDNEIVQSDDNYSYISTFMDSFEYNLKKLDENPYNTDFFDYVDIESFCKWYICANLIAVEDPNFYYVLHSKGDKLHSMPMWDAEYSLGLWSNTWKQQRPEPLVESLIRERPYFPYLLQSPLFVEELRHQWESSKPQIDTIKSVLAHKVEEISLAGERNLSRWPEKDKHLHIFFDSWKEECDYISTFFDNRIIWFDLYIKSL